MSGCPVDHQALSNATPSEKAMAFFDALEPADTDFMMGQWQGETVPTDHPMDGLLEHYNWYGKEFVTTDHVHPLVFRRPNGELVKLDPRWMPLRHARSNALSNSAAASKIFDVASRLMETTESRARLRMTEYRGKVSATMIYDDLPINDVFRKIDDNSVLGVMDLKGMRQPFFFKLTRVTPA